MNNENLKRRTKKFALDIVETVEEEADESCFWLELLVDAGKLASTLAAPLIREASELTAIAVSSIHTARKSEAQRRAPQLSTLRTLNSALPT